MKNRDEYLESIYAKRDSEIIKRKKRVSVLTSVLCLGVCFASVFAFLPKHFGTETFLNKSKNSENKIFTEFNSSSETPTVSDELFTFCVTYPAVYNESHLQVTDGIGNANMNDKEETVTNNNKSTSSNMIQQTEIAAESPSESTTKGIYSENVGGVYNPDSFYSKPSFGASGEIAFEPCDPPENPGTPAVTTYDDIPTTKSNKLATDEEAIVEAKKSVPGDEVEKINDDKTHVTVTVTSNGQTTYTVYFYTDYKLFKIELDAVTLEKIECTEKNLLTGNDNFYSPPHYPETTEALPEYKPQ